MNERAIRALIAKWDDEEDSVFFNHDERRGIRKCREELEALLAVGEEQPPTGKIPKGMPD